ncbi:keratin-associated protein 19-2-like [Oxyura jamaicensis]|uniref:keratin-associated protein 19-2-like n=1 Tax=Oxyura jamaicensis TaxID=8884 RepID=UPI0015A6A67C|nr:keratin-associated protein 19-2-like [Oxyura jamaicensis]
MTFNRDFYYDGYYSPFSYEDQYIFGGLNGYRFGSPYGFYREHYRYGSPYGYRSFGNLYGSRGLNVYGGYYGNGDFLNFGYGYPLFSHFGNRYSY